MEIALVLMIRVLGRRMNRLTNPLRVAYRFSRRLRMLDAMWLLHVPADQVALESDCAEMVVRKVPESELVRLLQDERVDPKVDLVGNRAGGKHTLLGAFIEGRLVSFLWLAEGRITDRDNFSRSSHLGVSVEMPAGNAFIYNAWTDPEHRGQRLIARLLGWAIEHHLPRVATLSTMIDWTNDRSCQAFERFGMKKLGLVVRAGCGPMQLSVIPKAAIKKGLHVASDAPGIKWKF